MRVKCGFVQPTQTHICLPVCKELQMQVCWLIFLPFLYAFDTFVRVKSLDAHTKAIEARPFRKHEANCLIYTSALDRT